MLAASLLLLALTLGYACACAAAPFRKCSRCAGTGKRSTPAGRSVGRCRPCTGTGWQVRAGRRLYTWWTRTHHHGNRPNPTDNPAPRTGRR